MSSSYKKQWKNKLLNFNKWLHLGVVLTYREKERREWDGEGKELDFLEYTCFLDLTLDPSKYLC